MTRGGSTKSQNPTGRIRQRRDTWDQRATQPLATSGGIQKVRKAKRNRLNPTIQDLPIILEHPPEDSDLPPRTGEVISSDEEDALKLRALEEELSKNLQVTAEAPVAVAVPVPSPAKALDAAPLPAAAPAAEEAKDFAGQFYPVARGVKKNSRES